MAFRASYGFQYNLITDSRNAKRVLKVFNHSKNELNPGQERHM